MPRRAPTSSSCGSTSSTARTSPARLDGRRTPVIVTCRAHWEGGRFSGQRRGTPTHPRVGNRARRRVCRRRSGRGLCRGPDRFARRAAASSCRRTCSAIRRRISPIATHALRATGAEVAEAGDPGDRRSKRRCRSSSSARRSQTSRPRTCAASRWAIRACRHACWPRACGTAGPMLATASRRDSCPRHAFCRDFRFRRIAADAALYAVVGNPDHPFAVAGHAQCRLRGAGIERGLPAARGA